MPHRICTCVLFVIMVLLAPRAEAQFGAPRVVPAEDYHLELNAMLWKPSPEVVLRTDRLGIIGNEIDFIREFGIEDKRFTEFRVTLKPGRKHKIRFQYVPISYNQNAILLRQFVFSGRTFTIGLPANADIEWKLWRFGYEWDFVSRERGFVGLVGELKYNQVKGAITSPIGAGATDAKAPVPAIGIIGRGYVARIVSITGEFTGFKLPDSFRADFHGEFWDFDLYGTVNLGRNVGIQGGYRSLDVEYVVDQDVGKLNMKGPYLGGVVRF